MRRRQYPTLDEQPCAHKQSDRRLASRLAKIPCRQPVLFLWVVSLVWCEFLAVRVMILGCTWPSLPGHRVGLDPPDTHVLVVADPQLTDRFSYSSITGGLALAATQFYADVYMMKAFKVLQWRRPGATFFLGDLFDGGPNPDVGRFWTDTEFAEEYERFERVFVSQASSPLHYVSGNHDLGYGAVMKDTTVKRFESYFGPVNMQVNVGNFTFVGLNSQNLDGGILSAETAGFVESFATTEKNGMSLGNPALPRILLSHIPFYKPDSVGCGPLRSQPDHVPSTRVGYLNGAIRYQNYVTQPTTRRVIGQVSPVFILSGHDHDQCVYTHEEGVNEQVVGTFSWLQGNLHPSYALITLRNPGGSAGSAGTAGTAGTGGGEGGEGDEGGWQRGGSSEPMFDIQLCFLPPQLYFYYWYIALAVLSVATLLVWPLLTHALVFGSGNSKKDGLLPTHRNSSNSFTRENIHVRFSTLALRTSSRELAYTTLACTALYITLVCTEFILPL